MRLVLSAEAAKRLRRLQPKLRMQIETAMESIARSPFGRHPNAKPLAGTRDGFRLRRGDWRIIYRIDRVTDTVHVETLGTRGDIYK